MICKYVFAVYTCRHRNAPFIHYLASVHVGGTATSEQGSPGLNLLTNYGLSLWR